MFRREAQNACRVRHENAVRVFDFGFTQDSAPYIVMELLTGPTLDEELHGKGPYPVMRIAEILPPVMRALGVAHGQGIVHRDMKPANVMLHREGTREIPKVLDFGIAKDLRSGGEETKNVVVGSASYIAPERLLGHKYDGKADVYSVGCTVFALLTGTLPFAVENDDFMALAVKHVHEKAPLVSKRRAGMSPIVDAVVARMLEKDPHMRPTAEEAAELFARMR